MQNAIRGIALKQMFNSLARGFASNSSAKMHVGGKEYTGAQLSRLFAAAAKLFDDAETAHKAAAIAVKKRDDALAEPLKLAQAAVKALEQYTGGDPIKLAEYGVPAVRRPEPLSPEQKLVRAEKARQTRTLRGTKGKRELAAIKAKGPFTVSVTGPSSGDSSARQPAPAVQPVQVVSAPISASMQVQPASPVSAPSLPAPVVSSGDTVATNGLSNGLAAPTLANGAGH